MLFSNTFSNSLKNLAKIIICFCLIYTPFFANAGAAEKWELVENVYDDIAKNMSYTAKKVNAIAANDYTYKTKVPVTSGIVGSSAKMLIRGGLASAAIYGIVEGVGWIIESGIVKKIKYVPSDPSLKIVFTMPNKPAGPPWYNTSKEALYKFYEERCAAGSSLYCGTWIIVSIDSDRIGAIDFQIKNQAGTIRTGAVYGVKNGSYDPSYTPIKIPVSDSELGDEIIKSPAAPQVIPEIYNPNQLAETPAREASEDALHKANPQPTKEPVGDSKPKPNVDTDGDGIPDSFDPALPSAGENFELPNFCSWAPSVCEFFGVQKQDNKEIKENQKLDTEQNKTFFEKVSEWFDWTRDPPQKDNEDNQVEIENIPKPVTSVNVSIGNDVCPSLPVSIRTPFANHSLDISPIYLCQQASMIKAFFIAFGFWTAAMIVGRRN